MPDYETLSLLSALNINCSRTERIMKSSRPLIYNSGNGDIWETWRGGTCIVIKWRLGQRNRYFCIAAKHTIRNRIGNELTSENINNIRILKYSKFNKDERLDERHWARVIAYHPLRNEVDFQDLFSDPDASDFVILETEDNAFDGASSIFTVRPKFIGTDTSEIVSSADGPLSPILVVSGFPSVNNTIDYDSETLLFHRKLICGYSIQNNQTSSIGQIDCTKCSDLPEDFDGLSGSPVFSFHNGRWKLAGIIIRGTASSKRLHFIKSNVIGFVLFSFAVATEEFMSRKHIENRRNRRQEEFRKKRKLPPQLDGGKIKKS